uniref:arylamine N-acetyltransferase n=1 Tax=Lepisosteus oculatus TaxID=7918 RepID=W5NNQ9_LEPOC|nr:PREDICTED: arylamine N-acetyltransferase, pineal gland isozyme NAT-3-like [Lepisosteus oculatus]
MEAEQYLLRIGCSGPVSPTLATLQLIHHKHLLSVPFENLTIHCGGQILLELPWIYDKIVTQHRGGFCFENNGLFSWLLSQLGFEVTLLSAQVRNSITGRYGPPFDHLIIQVVLEGRRWLCNVGFGAGFQLPLSLETGEPQQQGDGLYRVRHRGETLFLETAREKPGEGEGGEGQGAWTELYKFTLQPRRLEEFKAMCWYHQSSPSSIFFCKSLCSLLLPGGRLSYMGRRLITTHSPPGEGGNGTRTVVELSDGEIPAVLRERFGIELPGPLTPKDENIVPPPPIY